jgi:F0F1-type ATP synthase membrane subunit b/b'
VIALRRLLSLAVLASLLTAASPLAVTATATAEEHHEASAEHEASGHHEPSIGDLMFPAINFAIYLVIVVRFVIPAMRDYLQKRHAEIIQTEAESSAQLTRAQGDLAASQARLAQLPKEADGIRQDLLAIATRQGERLKAQAEETGTRRLADAALLAEQERRRALDGLRAELATTTIRLAEGRIRGALNSDDQRGFVQQFLKDAVAR